MDITQHDAYDKSLSKPMTILSLASKNNPIQQIMTAIARIEFKCELIIHKDLQQTN